MPLTIGQVLHNRYRIDALLGQGGMGAVYRAFDLALIRRCAVKELVPPAGTPPAEVAQLHAQFRQEASVLANLSHPGLPRVTDYFPWGAGEFLVMDYVEGHSLEEWVAQAAGRGLDEAQVLAWADQLLDALAYCHGQDILHRDVKPANIIITSQNRAMLVDFGLVKRWDPNDPYTKTILRGMGTLSYAPPEQYGTGAVHTDARSDLYSLGATLYHALAGRAPATAAERMANPACLPALRACNPAVSPHVEAAVLRAMALIQAQRFQTAGEMRAALAQGPTVPLPLPLPVPARPPARALPRWAWWAAAAGVVLLLFAVFRLFWPPPRPGGPTPAASLPPTAAAAVPTQAPAPATSPPPTAAPGTASLLPTVPPTLRATFTPSAPATARVEVGSIPSTSTPATTPTRPPTPTVLPGRGQGRIAFVSDRDGNNELYVMGGDGTGVQRLTHSAGDDWSPAWSPDGQQIAFTSSRDASVSGMHNIYRMDAQGGHVVRLTSNQAWDEYAAWSPDGRRLAFVTTADGNAEIFVLELGGGTSWRLTYTPAEDRYPAWSPDGGRIAFSSRAAGTWQIFVMEADGSGRVQLTTGANNWHPAWCPDGGRIAFVSDRSGSSDIYVMAPDGSGPKRLTAGDAEDDHPAWSPDGTAIAFWSSRQGGNHDVWLMWSDGSGQTRLTTHPASDGAPTWGP